jgi:hypothetical protein
MFTQRTVFVLGAGASMPYGYPSGQALVDDIVSGGESDEIRQTRRDAGFDNQQFASLQRALQRGKPASIDEFLEWRTEYLDIGKFCIAQRLLRCEHDAGLFEKNDEQHWYASFIRLVAPTKNAAFDNRIAIITFNYDRSLEHFLFEAFRERFAATEQEAADFIKSLQIIHVHGQLGHLPWQSEAGFAYGGGLTVEKLKTAVAGMKIIHEADGNAGDFKRAREFLVTARYAFFFGFGFHRLNTERLGLPGEWTDGRNRHFAGTCSGYKDAEKELIADRLKRQVEFPNRNYRVHDLMREHHQFLYASEGRA